MATNTLSISHLAFKGSGKILIMCICELAMDCMVLGLNFIIK